MMSLCKKIFLLITLLSSVVSAQQTQSWSRISRGTNLPSKIWPVGYLYFRTSDSTLAASSGASWIKFPSEQMIELNADDLIQTTADSASDTTAFFMKAKIFTLGDTVTFSFGVPSRFIKINSIVLIGGTTSATGDSAAFSLRLKQVATDSSYSRSFIAAKIDSTDLGAGNIQKEWTFSSFTSFTAGLRSTFIGKFWRSACTNNAAAKVYVFKVFIFGVGLN